VPDASVNPTRSRNMRAIRGKNTRPEILVRKMLHAAGFRFRLHSNKLPGKPDVVLPRYRAVVFIHGCFWHQHNCPAFKMPKTRQSFWQEKIEGNASRDIASQQKIIELGWRVAVIWECTLRGRNKLSSEEIIHRLSDWINSDTIFLQIEPALSDL
jgi:DNA mismatch endonuclease, patch repair protein